MELVLIRHGLPVRDESSSDPPLADLGRDQAQRAAQALARGRIDAVYASPMKRAHETARPFAELGGHPIRLEPRVVEFDRATGRYIPMEELKRDDYPAWQAFVASGGDVDIAGFQATVVEALEEIIARHSGQTVAVFCHGGVVNVWTAHVLGMAPRLFFEPKYASIHRYLCARSGERNLVSLNDVAHLADL